VTVKNKIVRFAKIWKPPRRDFGFFEDWRNFGNPQKFGKFLKLGVALILRFVLTDLLLIQTKFALVRPGPYFIKLEPILKDRLQNKQTNSTA
jgi:hypothetical protein